MKPLSFLVASLLVNACLFFLLSKGNGAVKGMPHQETWTVREVFSAAPPPRPAPVQDDAPRELIPDALVQTLQTNDPSAQGPAPEAFAPRFELSALSFAGSLAIGGPSVPVFTGAGGSPLGVDGGLPGGDGSGALPGRAPVDRNPQRALTPLPPYPSWARIRRLEGVVSLQFTVNTEGSVVDVVLESVEGDERFGPIAVEAVKSWRYEPGMYQGRTVPVRLIQRVRFSLVNR